MFLIHFLPFLFFHSFSFPPPFLSLDGSFESTVEAYQLNGGDPAAQRRRFSSSTVKAQQLNGGGSAAQQRRLPSSALNGGGSVSIASPHRSRLPTSLSFETQSQDAVDDAVERSKRQRLEQAGVSYTGQS